MYNTALLCGAQDVLTDGAWVRAERGPKDDAAVGPTPREGQALTPFGDRTKGRPGRLDAARRGRGTSLEENTRSSPFLP